MPSCSNPKCDRYAPHSVRLLVFIFPLMLLLPSQGLLAEPYYSELVIPFILQMYQKPIKQVRLVLLDLVDSYAPSVALDDLQTGIMPPLMKGVEEADDE